MPPDPGQRADRTARPPLGAVPHMFHGHRQALEACEACT
jgi:hypothetical protein